MNITALLPILSFFYAKILDKHIKEFHTIVSMYVHVIPFDVHLWKEIFLSDSQLYSEPL